MKALFVVVVLLSLICTGWCSWQRNQITLKNGKYRNLLVAINKDIPENDELIDEIKSAFTGGSSKLFEATYNRTYWKTITILVPKSWTPKPEYEPVTSESFDRANVIIDSPNPRWDDNPYTHQLGGCGEAGEYIHLTPNYLLDKQQSEFIWGPVDKLLVHEWGHLRWGLFDEYTTSDAGSAAFYATSDHVVEATRCSLAIKGEYVNIFTLKQCYLDPATGVYQPECVFFPILEGQVATASIMYGQFLDSVKTFCNSDRSDPLTLHDVEAPHKHNIMCQSKSCWDVMLETDDFKNNNNPPIAGDTDTTPNFRIVQPGDRRIVLVLDTSGSMGGDNIEILLQASTHYLRYTVDEGSYVGIVHFDVKGNVLSELVLITNETSSRDTLVAALPKVASGGTSIGSGVLMGIDVLSRGGDKPAGGYLLVISDGDNTNYPGIPDVLDDIDTAGVIVDTIAFTDAADNELRDLSDASGGLAFFFAGDADISTLNNAFSATITTRPDLSSQSLPITLYSGSQTVPRNGNVTVLVFIDAGVGLDTVFSFSWIGALIEVVLEKPDGSLVDESLYNIDTQTKLMTIKIGGTAPTGYWKITIANALKSSPSQVVTVNVESKQSTNEDPIEVLALVSDPTVDLNNVPVVIIYAIVTKGYLPVLNVQVVAVIEGPDAIEEILLLDKGAEPDITIDDGVYSGYFFSFTDNGRYSIAIKVENSANTAVVSRAKATGSLPKRPDTINKELPAFEPTGMFVRTASGGVIEVEGYSKQNQDKLSPSRILDLRVLQTSYAEQSVILQWTAVGDDFDKGTASKYELMAAGNYTKLFEDFENALLVTNNDLLQGNLSDISSAGFTEKITIKVPTKGENVTYFFAIRAADERGNMGDVSNIVSANMEYIASIPEEENSHTALWATLGSILGVALIAGIIFGMFYHRKMKKQTKVEKGLDETSGKVNNTYEP
ncbi:calcium-activated chloride channel regulator 4-like [Antedon mediterranea]|uniref:calcium-activated chloride channel regulator 4-like n=1 Tax=Antedon mediterranea TaxID=105859 RepID=UPI003AF6CF60